MTSVLISKRKFSEIRDAQTWPREGGDREEMDVPISQRTPSMASHHLKPGGRCGFSLGVSRRNQPHPCLDFGQKNRRKTFHLQRAQRGGRAVKITSPAEGKSAGGGARLWHNHQSLVLQFGSMGVCASDFHPKKKSPREQSPVRNP